MFGFFKFKKKIVAEIMTLLIVIYIFKDIKKKKRIKSIYMNFKKIILIKNCKIIHLSIIQV